MLEQSQLDDLSHADRLQRELALTFARALHSHFCATCGRMGICTVISCEFRPSDLRLLLGPCGADGNHAHKERWVCFLCKAPRVESARDEVGGGDDEA